MMTIVNNQLQHVEVQRMEFCRAHFFAFNLKKYAISFSYTKLRGH